MKKLIIFALMICMITSSCKKDIKPSDEVLKEKFKDIEIRIPETPIYVNRDCDTPKEVMIEFLYQQKMEGLDQMFLVNDSTVNWDLKWRHKHLNTPSSPNYISKFYLDNINVKTDSISHQLNIAEIRIPSNSNYHQLRIEIEKDSGVYYSTSVPIKYVKTNDQIEFIRRSYPLTRLRSWTEIRSGKDNLPYTGLSAEFGLKHFPWPNNNYMYDIHNEYSLKKGTAYDCNFNLVYKDSMSKDSIIRKIDIAGYVDKNRRNKIQIEPGFSYVQKYGNWLSSEELSTQKLRLEDWGYQMQLHTNANMEDSSITLPCFVQFYNYCYAKRYEGTLTNCQEIDTLEEESLYITNKIDLPTREVKIRK